MSKLEKIYADMSGGLGNLLFDCAHAYTIGKKLNVPVEYHLRSSLVFKDKSRGTQYSEFVKGNYLRLFSRFGISLDEINVKQFDGDYQKASIKNFCQHPNHYTNNKAVIINGCWPDFSDLECKEIQDMFEIDKTTKNEIEHQFCDILENQNRVSIHVRRGDFLNYPNLKNLLDETDYYQRAIKQCGDDNVFIIISDDIEYCKKKFNGDKFIFIENTTPLQDLYIQTYCRTNILANSTFSYWGSFLNKSKNQIIIKPSYCNYKIIKDGVKFITI